VDDDIRRLALAREAVGPDIRIAIDANQRWGVAEAQSWMAALAPYQPYWIEEPTSPDEILGLAAIKKAIAPVKVAVGEHVANRVIFKQLLQAGAADVLTIDACRVAGVNENLAILLLAAKYGVAICPHAGGVGLCEMVQHLAMFDFVGVGTASDRVLEYVDHLHEHFTDPVRIVAGHYLAPTRPGFSTTLRPETLRNYLFPDGAVWRELASQLSAKLGKEL
jgi:L-fuconate dehydratase